jgi:transcription-repair coupling factor (superfamily II helicase)
MYPDAKYFAQAGAVSIPLPVVDGAVLEDAALIEWTKSVLTALFPAPVLAESEKQS